MRACTTNIARSMGYLSQPSADERMNGQNVIAMGTPSSEIVSYHQSGTSRDAYLAARAAFGRKRRGRVTLYG